MKVIHVPDIGLPLGLAPLLVDCFKEIRAWSKAHPDHVPIPADLQPETGPTEGTGRPCPLLAVSNAKAMDAADAEIRSVFKPGEIITPDMVAGQAQDAPRKRCWPAAGRPSKQARGKFMLAVDEGPRCCRRLSRRA